MPRCRISTSRSSCHSASGSDHGRVSKPAAWSAGGVKTNRIETKCRVSVCGNRDPFGRNLFSRTAPVRASAKLRLKLARSHVGAADDDGYVLTRRGLVCAGEQRRDPDRGGGLGGDPDCL